MLHLISLAIVSMAGLAQARVGRLQPRIDADECCPCPASSAPREPAIVTVTHPAPATETTTIYATHNQPAPTPETVTVKQTVTESGTTVYVTKDNSPEQVAVTVTVTPESPKAVNVSPELSPPTEEMPEINEDQIITETIQPEKAAAAAPAKGPKTVTLSVAPAGYKTVTVESSPTSTQEPSIVTVTVGPQEPSPVAAPQDTDEQVITKTIGNSKPENNAKPNVQTVTENDGGLTTVTINMPSMVSVTAAPVVKVAAPAKELKTITQSVHNGDNTDIEINIVNINTGDIILCKKQGSTLPCDGDIRSVIQPQSSTTSCPPVINSTSIVTAFNTVTLTVGWGHNATNGSGSGSTGTISFEGRTPRAPLTVRW